LKKQKVMDFLPATDVVGIGIFYTERLGNCLVLLFFSLLLYVFE